MARRSTPSLRSRRMMTAGIVLVVCSAVVLAAIVLRQAHEMREASESSASAAIPSGWSTYTNPSLKLSVAVPSDADIVANPETVSSITDRLGRVGGIIVNDNAYEKPHWSAVAYTTQAKLEHDFGAADGGTLVDEMKSIGLQVKTTMIDGVTASVFSGVHPVDGVGGSDYDYVAAEVVGPTYTYMIQFYNMGTDPDAAAITQYLSGFDAE
ncbi:MAG: hypothetical protein AAB473_00535 [Patescibacteria group bacterium]|mgnify:CR=1 FL=1